MTNSSEQDRFTQDGTPSAPRLRALVTGVGRTAGIGVGIAGRPAASGWDVAFTHWPPYGDRMPWGRESGATEAISRSLAAHGASVTAVEADLSDPDTPVRVFDEVEERLGGVTVLVMCHCESVDSGLLDTTVESFGRHFAVNARATWLLIREFGRRFAVEPGSGRIVSLTSDHTVGNPPTGRAREPWPGAPSPPPMNSPTSA